MDKGHLDQQRKNQRSTKTKITVSEPTASELANIQLDLYATVTEPTGQIYTDQTGRFITPSSTGKNYLIVLYDYDSNHIFALPIKNRKATTILEGYKTLHARLCRAGL
jgi:hypothetical protein